MPKVGWEEEGRKGHRSGAAGLQTQERPFKIPFLEGLVASTAAGWSSAWNGYFLMKLLSESPERLRTHLECSELGVLSKAYQRLPAQAQQVAHLAQIIYFPLH